MKLRTRKVVGAAVLAALLSSAAPAWGQYELGDGRKLDRNLQRGSGGVNPAQQPNSYGRYQDAIITGNVGGLQRFRGSIDYGAVGEFSEPTAASDFYEFRRQSLPPNAVTRFQEEQLQSGTGRGQNPLVYPGGRGGGILLRSGAGVSAGQMTNQYERYPGISGFYRDDSLIGGASARGKIEPSLDIGTIVDDPIGSYEQRLGLRRARDGGLREITASPLMGLRSRMLDRLDRYNMPLNEIDPATDQPLPAEGEQSADDEEAEADGQTPEGPGQAEDQRVRRGIMGRSRIDRQVAPGLLLGQRLGEATAEDQRQTDGRQMPEAGRGAGDAARPSFSADELRRRVLGPPPNRLAARPGQDVYQDVLRRIREQTGTADEQMIGQSGRVPPEDRLAGTNEADNEEDAESALERIQRQIEEANEQAAGQASEDGEDAPAGADDGATADDQDVSSVRELMRQLDYDLPPLKSFTGSEKTAFNRAMQEAEQRMEAELYFEAASIYRRAMRLKPGDPLAQIGRAHAELGAGLFLSASQNLRGVLSNHPELVAMRYEPPLLPQQERLVSLRNQLQTVAEDTKWPYAALLLGYIAYQQGDTAEVRAALDLMEEKSRRDPLPRVLRRLWLDGNPDAPAEDEQDPEPGAEPNGDPQEPSETSSSFGPDFQLQDKSTDGGASAD